MNKDSTQNLFATVAKSKLEFVNIVASKVTLYMLGTHEVNDHWLFKGRHDGRSSALLKVQLALH